jgi:hypothetical protein
MAKTQTSKRLGLRAIGDEVSAEYDRFAVLSAKTLGFYARRINQWDRGCHRWHGERHFLANIRIG